MKCYTFNNISYFDQPFEAENRLIASIRESLSKESAIEIPEGLSFSFNPKISQVYVSLFQEGINSIRWGAKRKTLQATIARVISKIKGNNRFHKFSVDNNSKCRILLEIVTQEWDCDIRQLTTSNCNEHRFEPGVTGLRYKYGHREQYFMPTDAVVHSVMGVDQLLNHLAKRTGVAKKTNSITERIRLMQASTMASHAITTVAFISYYDQLLPLFRGFPMPTLCSKARIIKSAIESVDWLIENMNADGSFLYYYDGTNNTEVDHAHPNMTQPLYNNILRHSGGTIALMKGYALTADKNYLVAAEKSLQFLISTFRQHKQQQHTCYYPFFNKKSKLGGAGIGLIAMMFYYIQTGDETYRKYLDGLVRHILSRIAEQGEMLGYYIHPQYQNGKPLVNPSEETRKALFSFYYPGEALFGLALYYNNISNIDNALQQEIHHKSLQALDFLIHIRPVKYQSMFRSLPSDAWLMQAIEEWVKVPGFKKQSYIDFVFNDAQAMIEHMYQEDNAPTFDYVGGFYYEYGEHVYHDASRCEGLMAAYYLAKYLNDDTRATHIIKQVRKSAKSLLYTQHTQQSTYAHLHPQRSIASFRFKLTRQWVRVDSVQHTVCFFARLYATGRAI